MGAKDFFIGGDRIIELRLESAGEKLQDLGRFDWYGLHGPEWQRSGENLETY